VLVPGDRKADIGKLRGIIGADDIKLASSEEVKERMNCEIGSCHPFGNLCGLKTYMDKKILDNETVAFNAGLHTKTITMDPRDLKKLVNPVVEDFAK
jgi:Ala-tRNA(Pro) deacylase